MRDGWVETTFGEVVVVNPEAARGRADDDEIVYVDLSSVSAESGISSELYRGSFGEAPGRARRVIRTQDVLVSTVRPYLRGFALVPEFLDGEIASTGFAVLRAKPSRILPGLVWAIVGMNNFVDYLMDRATGSSYPAVRPDDVSSFSFCLPPLDEQRRIVDLVSSVDAFIGALQQQADTARTARNAVLHELLSAGGHDWTESTLGDIAEYINGYPFKPSDLGDEGTAVIRIKQLLDPMEKVDRTTVDVPERCVLSNGDIVFSWSGTLAVRVWNRGSAYLNQHLFRVIEKTGVSHEWLPLVIDHAIDDLVEKSHGTTMKHITKQTLLPHQVFLPPLDEQKRIVEIVSAMDDVIQSTEQAVSDAKNLRSGLLSDLLSGEHEIPASYDSLLGAA